MPDLGSKRSQEGKDKRDAKRHNSHFIDVMWVRSNYLKYSFNCNFHFLLLEGALKESKVRHKSTTDDSYDFCYTFSPVLFHTVFT